MARQRKPVPSSPPIEPDEDKTLWQWKEEKAAADNAAAETEQRRQCVLKMADAFIAVKRGMPDSGDEEQDALAFAGSLGHLVRLVAQNPELVHRTPDKID